MFSTTTNNYFTLNFIKVLLLHTDSPQDKKTLQENPLFRTQMMPMVDQLRHSSTDHLTNNTAPYHIVIQIIIYINHGWGSNCVELKDHTHN